VESLAYLATDAAIAPLLDTFHDDPLPMIRERAACGLTGRMFTAHQRMPLPHSSFPAGRRHSKATRECVFQALRDITGQDLPHDGTRWRDWYRPREA
jgi:hypothetical protein